MSITNCVASCAYNPLLNVVRHLLGYTLGALHLCAACECSHATRLNTIESFSPSILQQQICCPAVTSTAWCAKKQAKSRGISSVAAKKDPPVTHYPFVCPDVDHINPHAAHVRCASHNKSHPANISGPVEPLRTILTTHLGTST